MNMISMNINEYFPIILAIIMTVAVGILLILLFISKKKNQNTEINFLQSFINDFLIDAPLGLSRIVV